MYLERKRDIEVNGAANNYDDLFFADYLNA